jgi:hypothetical protein
VSERLERDCVGPLLPEGNDPSALHVYLGALHRRSLRLGLYRHPLAEPEERVLMPAATSSAP